MTRDYFAALEWSHNGYNWVIVTDGGEVAYRRDSLADTSTSQTVLRLHEQRKELTGELTCLVDSSSGLIAEMLCAAGLTVRRVDPASVEASRPPYIRRILLEQGPRAFRKSIAVKEKSGFLEGRKSDLLDGIRDAAAVEAQLKNTGRFVTQGDPRQRRVALTFDDGPQPPYTEQILNVLKEQNVRATFFCVGHQVVANSGLAARIVEEGHGLGNHTLTHPFIPDISADQLATQVRVTAHQIKRATGVDPVLFRPPYGARTADALTQLVDLGQTIVTWDVSSVDWEADSPGDIVSRVISGVDNGSIVLMHDGGGDRHNTVEALPTLIHALRSQEFEFVTVQEMEAGPRDNTAGRFTAERETGQDSNRR